MKLKAIPILIIILLALIPVYILIKYLERIIQPRESLKQFLLWMITVMTLIFALTFIIVFFIRMLFPGA